MAQRDPSTVVVMRVWKQGDEVWGRVLIERPGREQGEDLGPATSIDGLCALVHRFLDGWAEEA